MTVLVTGCAGFIGSFACEALLARGDDVVGIDNVNDYYDVRLKHDRLARLRQRSAFRFEGVDIADRAAVDAVFASHRFDRALHLAAQAGVRYSLVNPAAYTASNLVGFGNVIEACRRAEVGHLVYASTSSVYGGNRKLPFAETDPVDHPVSYYAATKKANELTAHSYSHLFGLPTTGLRFFTVYGPWGRPDMSPMLFARAIVEGRADRGLQPRRHDARLHVRRRHRPRGRSASSIDRRRPTRRSMRCDRTPRPAARPGASTTSATTGRSTC